MRCTEFFVYFSRLLDCDHESRSLSILNEEIYFLAKMRTLLVL